MVKVAIVPTLDIRVSSGTVSESVLSRRNPEAIYTNYWNDYHSGFSYFLLYLPAPKY